MYNKKIPVDTTCGFHIAMEVMGGKWKPFILYELINGPLRPSELRRRIPEASERVLNQQLSELLLYGMVEREVIDTVRCHSEYKLSAKGQTLIPLILQLKDWGEHFKPTLIEILNKKGELEMPV